MPIYEYRCQDCNRRYSVLTLRISETPDPVCDRCGSRAATRLMSRFAMPKSDDARLDALTDPAALGDLDENDPRSVSRWMRRMSREMGEDLGDEDFEAMMDEMESSDGGDEPESPDEES